jgi:hypothetical protein
MKQRFRFAYTSQGTIPGSQLPRLTFSLRNDQRSISVTGIVDSGASVNLLPYDLGLQLGAVWERQKRLPPIGGAFGNQESRALQVSAYHPQLTPSRPVELIFAWTSTTDVRVLFG